MKHVVFTIMLAIVLLSTAHGYVRGLNLPTWGMSRPRDNARRGAIRGALTSFAALLIVLCLWWIAGALTQ